MGRDFKTDLETCRRIHKLYDNQLSQAQQRRIEWQTLPKILNIAISALEEVLAQEEQADELEECIKYIDIARLFIENRWLIDKFCISSSCEWLEHGGPGPIRECAYCVTSWLKDEAKKGVIEDGQQ